MSRPLTFALDAHQDLLDTLNGYHRGGNLAAAQTLTFGADVSHWQGPVDWSAFKAAGFGFVVIKATEGVAYTDPRMVSYRAGAHAAGLTVLLYHYVGSSASRRVYDPVSESAYFTSVVGPLAVGEGVALDYEPIVPPANPPVWSRAWLDRTRSVLAVPGPWIYLNSSTEARYDWTGAGVSANYGLWLAKYDNNPDQDPAVHWPNLTAEQYWDKATVPGVPGPVDVDVFYGPLAQLQKFCKQGGPPPPPPPPPPPEDDMLPEDRALLEETHLFAQQARDSAYGANDRAGYILTGQNTQVIPPLEELTTGGVSAADVAAALAADTGFVADLAEQVGVKLDALFADRFKS